MVRAAALAYAGAALALVLALRIGDGSVTALVQGWYRPVLLATVAVLAGCAALVLWKTMRSGERFVIRPVARDVAMAAVVMAPVLLGLVYRPEPLSGGSIEARGDAATQFGAGASEGRPEARNIYQWAYEFQASPVGQLVGQPVDIVGFVYHPKPGPRPGGFLAARFVVACCVADAQGVTLAVQWPGSDRLAPDAWVRIRGRVATAVDGSPVVLAETIEQIDAPSNPYIYP